MCEPLRTQRRRQRTAGEDAGHRFTDEHDKSVLYAKSKGLGVSLGGSLNETDQSARIAVHVALACQPDYIFAKPGNGGDEALMIVRNEMLRTLKIMDWMAKR